MKEFRDEVVFVTPSSSVSRDRHLPVFYPVHPFLSKPHPTLEKTPERVEVRVQGHPLVDRASPDPSVCLSTTGRTEEASNIYKDPRGRSRPGSFTTRVRLGWGEPTPIVESDSGKRGLGLCSDAN